MKPPKTLNSLMSEYGPEIWTNHKKLEPLLLPSNKINNIEWNKYYKEKFYKNQVVLHHTVSGPGINGDLATWAKNRADIAVCIIIGRDGTINQLFSSRYWAYHLGAGNVELDKHSIAVELDNWGQLEERSGSLYNIYGGEVNVQTTNYLTPFRGETIFEAYPKAQLESLGELLLLWKERYGIPLDYKEDMWDMSSRALSGDPGVWAHVSYRPWPSRRNKWDCHPDPQLIRMLKSL